MRSKRSSFSFLLRPYRSVGISLGIISLMAVTACSSPSTSNQSSSIKFQQYYIQGQQLYNQYCSNCHQLNGSGLGRVYPPLDKSDFMDTNLDEVICLMKYGIKESITVNGIEYHQPMAGISTLSDLEVAEIATYIYNTWSHEQGLIEVQYVSTTLKSCQEKQ